MTAVHSVLQARHRASSQNIDVFLANKSLRKNFKVLVIEQGYLPFELNKPYGD